MASADLALKELTRTVKRSSEHTSEDIRSHAEQNNATVQKVLKDVSRVFASNSRQSSNLAGLFSEAVSETQQVSRKADATNNLLQQTLSLQSTMLTEMKYFNSNLRALQTAILNNPNSNTNGGVGVGTGATTGGGLNIGKALAALGIGGFLGVSAAKMATGGAGENNNSETSESSSTSNRPMRQGAGGKINTAQSAELIRKAGGNDDEARILAAIAQAESSGNPNAHNDKGRDDSYGLWQINLKSDRARLKMLGLSDPSQLFDPETNAKAALMLYRGQLGARGGYQHWTMYNNGEYKKYLQGGEQREGAVAQRQQQTPRQPPVPRDTPAASAQPQQRQQTESQPQRQRTASNSPAVSTKDTSTNNEEAKQYLSSREHGGRGFVGVSAERLDSSFASRLQRAIADAEKATGDTVRITEGYRDSATQAQYYANYVQRPIEWQGQTYTPKKKGGIAAPPGRSRHEQGTAVDISDGPARRWLAQNAAKYGLTWGGNWTTPDPPHFEMARGGGGSNEDSSPTRSASSTPNKRTAEMQQPSGETRANRINQIAETPSNPDLAAAVPSIFSGASQDMPNYGGQGNMFNSAIDMASLNSGITPPWIWMLKNAFPGIGGRIMV